MIHFVKGNLFDNEYNVSALAHGCNIKGVMGAGIAKELRARWPGMYELYKHNCDVGNFICGDALLWRGDYPHSFAIFCLATQHFPGPTARTAWIRLSVYEMIRIAREEQIKSIAMPAIGCGLGGLQWDDLRDTLSLPVFQKVKDIDLYVYEPHE